MLNKQLSILLIVPCYNEERRLPLDEYKAFLDNDLYSTIDILFVNDGSKDDTLTVLEDLAKAYHNVSVLDLESNQGKAEAIRKGMLSKAESTYDYLGFFDADLATPLEEVHSLIHAINTNKKPYLVMGARVKLLGSTDIKRKLMRHYIGRVFATIVSNMLKLSVYDTQCGAKLIKRGIVPSIFQNEFSSKWLFDVEILFRLKNEFPDFKERIIEVPIKKWEDKDGSKINLSYYFRAPFDLLKIYFKYV